VPAPLGASMSQGTSGLRAPNHSDAPARRSGMTDAITRMLLRGRKGKDPRKNVVRGDSANDGMLGAAGGP
jgi:hypothetical protein